MEYLNESRVQVAAAALGMAECAFDKALNYAKERTVFGQKLLDLPIIQHKIAEMTAKIECVKLIVYKAAWLVDKGKPDPLIASVAKLEAARTATYVANEAIQILGGYGYMADQDVERIYRDTRGSEIYEGTNEIQKNTIANWLIKRIGKQ
ncbi:acyl-CoA dehydrogenase, partial [Candidatus Bathyarchaeota archaeon]